MYTQRTTAEYTTQSGNGHFLVYTYTPSWRKNLPGLKPKSWTYNFLEVSGHNIDSSQTWGFRTQCLHYKPVTNHFCSDFCTNYIQEFGLWWGWCVHAHPFHYIYHHVQSFSARPSWEGRLTLPISTLTLYVICVSHFGSKGETHSLAEGGTHFRLRDRHAGTLFISICIL
jgi:hypothetical protein